MAPLDGDCSAPWEMGTAQSQLASSGNHACFTEMEHGKQTELNFYLQFKYKQNILTTALYRQMSCQQSLIDSTPHSGIQMDGQLPVAVGILSLAV